MPNYETLCILHPELAETQIKELIASMQRILESMQGTVLRVDEWGMRDLAYRINKQRRGYYVRLEYDAPAPALKELERTLRLNEYILRFLSVRRTPPVAAAQAPARPPAAPSAPPETRAESQ